jgi:hypothetical protein
MKPVAFFTPEHAVARFRAIRANDAKGLPRVRFSVCQSKIRNPISAILLRLFLKTEN